MIEKLKELHPENNPRLYSLDDKGLSRLFSDLNRKYCRYNATAREWYIFNGKAWVVDTEHMKVLQKAKEFAETLLLYSVNIEDEQRKNMWQKKVINYTQYRYRQTLIQDARDCYPFTQPELDANLDLFNCINGTLNLKTGEFMEHNPDDMLSKLSNVFYDPEVRSARFEKFIREIMQNDRDKIRYLQKVLGYSLTAETNLETCWLLYGATTRNGKSTLTETIGYMMGNTSGYAMSMQPQTLAQKQNKDSRQASGDIARLDGCRFLNASEPPKRMLFDTALLKTLLGRDSITARHLHEREFEFIPRFKLFINTNYLPLITDDSIFASGRINVIEFSRHFQQGEQDKTLKEKLKTRRNISGIFNWCLDGLKLYREEGAIPPQAVISATDEYRKKSDKVGIFIKETLRPKTDNNMKASDVYLKYKSWCGCNGYSPESKTNFYEELKAKGLLSDRGTVDGITVYNVVRGYEAFGTVNV